MPYKVKRKKKVRTIKPSSSVDYSTGPAYSTTSMSQSTAEKMYNRAGYEDTGLRYKTVQNPDGTFTRMSIDSSSAY